MGPVRRRLITAALLVFPAPAWAEVCEELRPNWDGTTMTGVGEMLHLFQTPLVLLLVLATALAVRFRREWAGVAVVVGWSLATFLLTGTGGSYGIMDLGRVEGCVGSPALFIAVAVAVCIGVVLYTAPRRRGQE